MVIASASVINAGPCLKIRLALSFIFIRRYITSEVGTLSSYPRPIQPLLANATSFVALVDGGAAVVTVVLLGVRFRFDLYRLRISEYTDRVRGRFGYRLFRWHNLSPFNDQLTPKFL